MNPEKSNSLLNGAAQNLNSDPITEFYSAMTNAGLHCQDALIADGTIHRFKNEGDKNGSHNGWYVFYSNDIPAGAFGNWKTEISETWSMKSKETMTPTELQAWRKQMKGAKVKREEEEEKIHAEARIKANRVWQAATVDPNCHSYIKNKQIIAFGIKQRGETLIIPLRDSEGVLHSLQFIDVDGNKRFLAGGRVKGCYCTIGTIKNSLYICEGYATGSSIHMHVDKDAAVVVAFNAGNLKPVAKVLHDKNPNIQIIIAADNDSFTEGNPGLTKAKAAAASIGAKMIWPNFDELNVSGTDFNDYVLAGGLK